jgi:sugar phosphate isomerase/epimerase
VDEYLGLFLRYGINPEIGFDALALETASKEAMAEMARLMKEQGRTITFHGPFMDLAPGGLDERVREVTARRLERRYHAHRAEWLSGSLATWEPLIQQAEEMGVVIHLENVYEQTPEMILTLIEEMDSENLGFCLDMGHMNVFGEVAHSDSHGPIGSGTVPFKELFQYLHDQEKRPVVTLEPHEEATLWVSLENLEKLWPWQEEETRRF